MDGAGRTGADAKGGRKKVRRFRLGWLAVAVLLMALSVAAVGIALEQDREMERIRANQAEAQARLAEAEARNRDAHETLDGVGTDSYIERIARDELGMVKPGERIVDPVE